MATTYAVKCDYCEKIHRKKNIKQHTKNVQGECIKFQFLSISNIDIQDVFAAQELQEVQGSNRIYDDSSQSAKQTKDVLD